MLLLGLFLSYAILLSLALAVAGHRSRTPGAPPTAIARQVSKVLIVGATGGTGRQLLMQALQRGLVVTALARNPSKLDVEHPSLTVVQGDVLDQKSLETAMRGQDAVLCALGHKRYFWPTRILSDGTRNILASMKSYGVPRLICETSLGIGDSAGRMGVYYTFFTIPVVLAFYFWDKTRQERTIAQSDSEWVIVRPAVLTNGEQRGRVRHGKDVGNYILTARISRADVAGFMLDQLTSNSYLRNSTGVSW